jgi:hypothetical protein
MLIRSAGSCEDNAVTSFRRCLGEALHC